MLLGMALLAALLAGCAADCTNSDWRGRGYDDGIAGHPPQDLRITRACPGFSQPRYLEGWQAGHDERDRGGGGY